MRPRALGLVLALVLPAIVFGVAWAALQRPERVEGRTLAMERSLRQADEVQVVVLGSSLARTNVDVDLLADGLDIPRRDVALLTLPNATAPHWYAVLKNRVYAKGHQPKLVLVVGALTTMVTPDVLMDTSVDRLMEQLTDDEPVIASKVFHTDDPGVFRWLYLRGQAWDLRDGWLQAWRDAALGLVFRGRLGGELGSKLAERANEVVFADERMAYELHRGGGTGLFVGAVEELSLEGLDVAEDSLLAEISELVEANGGRAVFVRTPFPPSNQGNDIVPPDVEAQTVQVLDELGAVYLDLRSLNLDDRYFRDMRHMSQEGAGVFTRAIAALLRSKGVAGRKAGASKDRSLAPTGAARAPATGAVEAPEARRVGPCAWRLDAGALAAVGDDAVAAAGRPGASPLRVVVGSEVLPREAGEPRRCRPGTAWRDGGFDVVTERNASAPRIELAADASFAVAADPAPAWWVHPGTTLAFSFDAGWPFPPGAFDAVLRATAFGGEAEVALEVAGVQVPVTRSGERLMAQAVPPVPRDGAWTVRVSSPPDGPFVLLQNLRLGRPPFSVHLAGLPETLAGASIRLVGGKVEDTEVAPVFADPPPRVEVEGPLKVLPRGIGMMPVPAYRFLADAGSSRDPTAHKCSPLRILREGEALPQHHAPCEEVGSLRAGRVCHAGDVLYFAAREGAARDDGGWSAALDPARLCERRNTKSTTPLRGAVWLYPGDRATFTVPAERAAAFLDGANLLEIAADPFGAVEDASLGVVLRAEGREVLRTTETSSGGRVVLRRALEPALPPRSADVQVELANPSGAWWLVLLAALSEDTTGSAGEAGVRGGLPARDGDDGTGDANGAALDEGLRVLSFEGTVTLSRSGEPPGLPAPKDLEVVRDRLVEGHLFALWPVSNPSLVKRGHGPWSPLRLADGGRPLRLVDDRSLLKEGGCEDCFLHLGQSVVLPKGSAKDPELVASLDGEVPMPVEGGSVVWVYPGTTVRAVVGGRRPSGQVRVRARIDLLAGERMSQAPGPVLRVGDREATFSPTEAGRVAELEVPSTGPFEVALEAPSGGAYVLWLELDLLEGDTVRRVWTPPLVEPMGAEAGD